MAQSQDLELKVKARTKDRTQCIEGENSESSIIRSRSDLSGFSRGTNLDNRTSVEIMEIFQSLNEKGLTTVLVTHEHDIAQFAKRVLVFRDGKIRLDDPVLVRPMATEVLKTLRTLED